MSLSLSVDNSATSTTEALVPALAHANAAEVRFRSVEVRGEFPAAFYGDVYAAPQAALFEPLDAWLAPDSRMSIEYLSAVPKRRLDERIDLTPDEVPNPECWNGNCDSLPGSVRPRERCSDPMDHGCRRMTSCQQDVCLVTADAAKLPAALRELYGFAQEHVILYVPEAFPAQSWAAARLGAANGLRAGYHVVHLLSPDADARASAAACFADAKTRALARFDAAHETSSDPRVFDCLFSPASMCSDVELPAHDQAEELAAELARAEVEQRCYELAPDMQLLGDPREQQITMRIGDGLNVWLPSESGKIAPSEGS